MPQPDALFLEHMLQALDRIEELLGQTTRDEFDGDWVVQDALIRELEIVGEAAGRVSSDLAQSHPEIPWGEPIGSTTPNGHGRYRHAPTPVRPVGHP